MLGMGRASQYAGWWGGGPLIIDITSESSISQSVYQTPSYSVALYNNGSEILEPRGIIDSATPSNSYCNIATISSAATFNNARSVFFYTFRPTYTGTAGTYSGGTTEFKDNSGDGGPRQAQTNITAGGNLTVSFNLGGSGNTINLGSYTTYNSKWMTVIMTTAETSSAYTDWNSPETSGNTYCRFAVYDTESAELIAKRDFRNTVGMANILNVSSNQVRIDYGGAGTRTYVQLDRGGDNLTNANTVFAGCWYSFGTMFDPVGETNTSWLTTRPSANIGNAVAWFNGQFANSITNGSVTYVAESDMDLYTNTDTSPDTAGAQLGSGKAGSSGGWTSAEWANVQSTTNIPKDKS